MSMSNTEKNAVKDIRRKTRRKFSTEEKIRIVLEGLRGFSLLQVVTLCYVSAKPPTTSPGNLSPSITKQRQYYETQN